MLNVNINVINETAGCIPQPAASFIYRKGCRAVQSNAFHAREPPIYIPVSATTKTTIMRKEIPGNGQVNETSPKNFPVTMIMAFFTTAIDTLKTLVIALGGGLGVWGVINLLEGYGNDNPGAKSQGMKQLMAGAGVALVGTVLIPLLSGLFG